MFIDFPHLMSLQQGSLMTHTDFRFKHHQVGQINVWFGRSFWPKVVGGFRYLLNIYNIYIYYQRKFSWTTSELRTVVMASILTIMLTTSPCQPHHHQVVGKRTRSGT